MQFVHEAVTLYSSINDMMDSHRLNKIMCYAHETNRFPHPSPYFPHSLAELVCPEEGKASSLVIPL